MSKLPGQPKQNDGNALLRNKKRSQSKKDGFLSQISANEPLASDEAWLRSSFRMPPVTISDLFDA